MASTESLQDYYRILEVPQSATLADIKQAYRRQARLQHPDKNSGAKSATEKFQLLSEAYTTLSDPSQRLLYDARWRPRFGQATQNRTPSFQPKSTSPESNDAAGVAWEKWRTLQRDKIAKAEMDKTRFEAELRELDRLDEEQARKLAAVDSWWNTVLLWGRQTLTDGERKRLANERHHRNASRRIKQTRLEELKLLLKQLLDETLRRWRVEEERQFREAMERIKKGQAEREATRQREQAASATRMRAEQARREQEREQERKRREQERKEWEQHRARFQRNRAEQDASQARSSFQHGGARASDSCSHRGWWKREARPARCQECHKFQARFYFVCPGCKFEACRWCMQVLK